MFWDSFDCQLQCEDLYTGPEEEALMQEILEQEILMQDQQLFEKIVHERL